MASTTLEPKSKGPLADLLAREDEAVVETLARANGITVFGPPGVVPGSRL